jgi:hypothetical protein
MSLPKTSHYGRFAPVAAKGHMPFKGTRTQKEVREDEERYDRAVVKALFA